MSSQETRLKANNSLVSRSLVILLLISSYLSLLNVFHINNSFLLFYFFELSLCFFWVTSDISYRFDLKYIPFIIYIVFVQYSTLFNILTGGSVMSIPKSLSILFLGFWSFIQLPELLFRSKKLLMIYYKLPIVFGVISSLVSILGIFEFHPFFELNNFDEKFPIIFLRSSSSFLFEPNVFAFTLLLGLFLVRRLNMSFLSRKIIQVILILGLISSYSRGAWAAYVIYLFFDLPKASRNVFFVIFSLIVIFLVFEYYNSISSVLVLDDILTGRPQLWYLTMKNLNWNWFFGLGFDLKTINNYLISIFHRNYFTTHNYFFDILMTSGVFTLISTVVVWIVSFRKVRLKEERAFLISVFFFLQFSPHNFGGASFIAIYLTSLVGMIWRKSLT